MIQGIGHRILQLAGRQANGVHPGPVGVQDGFGLFLPLDQAFLIRQVFQLSFQRKQTVAEPVALRRQ